MSKSLKRVKAALDAAGSKAKIIEYTESTRIAQAAAEALDCEVDQIAKSILFAGETSGTLYLFVTAGTQRVDMKLAAVLAQEPLGRADASVIRKVSGFVIGGVSPIGHITPPTVFFDQTLMGFDKIYAAAGTPNHVFGCSPAEMYRISNAQLADFIVISK